MEFKYISELTEISDLMKKDCIEMEKKRKELDKKYREEFFEMKRREEIL